MTHTERLARRIALARHGTDAYWANYLQAAREAVAGLRQIAAETENAEVSAMLARMFSKQ
jgi:hypothetical protein